MACFGTKRDIDPTCILSDRDGGSPTMDSRNENAIRVLFVSCVHSKVIQLDEMEIKVMNLFVKIVLFG